MTSYPAIDEVIAVHAQLIAQTGQGQVLGNLVYNVAHLLDPGGTLNLLTILNQLGL